MKAVGNFFHLSVEKRKQTSPRNPVKRKLLENACTRTKTPHGHARVSSAHPACKRVTPDTINVCTCWRLHPSMDRKKSFLSYPTCMYTQDLMLDVDFELKTYPLTVFLLIHSTNYLRSTLVRRRLMWEPFRIAKYLQYHASKTVHKVSSHVETIAMVMIESENVVCLASRQVVVKGVRLTLCHTDGRFLVASPSDTVTSKLIKRLPYPLFILFEVSQTSCGKVCLSNYSSIEGDERLSFVLS